MQRKPQLNTEKTLEDAIMAAKDEQINKAVQGQPKEQPPKEEFEPDKLRRQTYYITELHIQAIEQMAFYEKMDKSEIVRKALEQYIPTKYLNLAIKR